MTDRHFFAGVNSPLGFYSNFDQIAPDKSCKRKIYIKGGAGMGKSTLMKKVAHIAHREGYENDVFHCSSDESSLDGIYIPKLKTAVLDATPPHNSDPAYPGVTGEIFNAADFLSRDKLEENTDEIIRFTALKSSAFSKTYKYLNSAAPIFRHISDLYEDAMYLHGINLELEKAIQKYLPVNTLPYEGNLRKLFASVIGPNGFVNYLDIIFKGCHTVAVGGGFGADVLIGKLMDTALSRGLSVDAFYCPMFPDSKVEHIVIHEIKVAFTTYNHYHHFAAKDTIDLNEYIREMPLYTDEPWNIADNLLKQAISSLEEARAAHSFLESFYTPAMDFDALSRATDKLIESIFE